MPRGLTTKQRVWIEEYLQCWNATEAARRAGYKWPAQSGYLNAIKDYVKQEIHKRLAAKAMGADEVLLRLGEQGRANAAEFYKQTDDGIQFDWDKILGESGHLIKSIAFTSSGPQLELHDAQSALALLGKHHGLFKERQEHSWEPEQLRAILDQRLQELARLRAPRSGRVGGAVDSGAPTGTDVSGLREEAPD